MPALKLCANRWHQTWDGGSVVGPTEMGVDWFDCFCGLAFGNDDGGDEGLNVSYAVFIDCSASATIRALGTRGGIYPDIIQIWVDNAVFWESDCNTGDYDSGELSISAGFHTIQITVIPHCGLPGFGTYWDISWSIKC
jgi:hypothetical protein